MLGGESGCGILEDYCWRGTQVLSGCGILEDWKGT